MSMSAVLRENDLVVRANRAAESAYDVLLRMNLPANIRDAVNRDMLSASDAIANGGDFLGENQVYAASCFLNARRRIAEALVVHIEQLINTDTSFATLADRTDFNVASFRYRIPQIDKTASGIDAGLLALMSLIPDYAKPFVAKMHANQTAQLYKEAQTAIQTLNSSEWNYLAAGADHPVVWWLAGCSVVKDTCSRNDLVRQVADFIELESDPMKRLAAAKKTYIEVIGSYKMQTIGAMTIPIGTDSGSQIGAFLEGHKIAVVHATKIGIYFLATPHDDLGLSGFQWSDKKDVSGKPLSGPVHGSKKFAKCCDINELERAVAVANNFLQNK